MSNSFWNSAGSGLIGSLGLLGSAGLGVLSANNMSGKAYGRMLSAMKYQADLNYENNTKYAKWSAENSPTFTRTGLVNAGYNPMLAVQNATSGSNATSFTSQGGYQQDQQTDAITNGISNGTDLAQLAINQQQTDSNVKLNEAQSRKFISEANNNEIHGKYLDKREEKELGLIGAQTDKLIRETSYMDQLADNMEAERRLQEMGIFVNARNTSINAFNAETSRKAYEIDKEVQDIIRDREKRYKEWGAKHPYWRNVDETISRYFSGFGASASKSYTKKL